MTLFWEEVEKTKSRSGGGGPTNRPLPDIPDTGWTPPSEFPRLEAAKVIALDTETKDPNLRSKGPGNIRGDGHIVGLSIGTEDGHRWYFPMRHEVGGGNMDPGMVLRWAKDELGRAHQPKIGANLMYDLGWLRTEGVDVRGQLIDVLFAEPLLDEYANSYSLDALSRKWLDESKVDEALYEWCARAYGGPPGRRQAANIYRAPVSLVGPYAEGDVDLPLRIWQHQQKQLQAEDLTSLFDIECRLIPLYIAMRERGVRVDITRAEQVREALFSKRDEALQRIHHLSGLRLDIWAAESVARAFDKIGISYPKTKKTKKPSFTADWLEHHPSEIAGLIRTARKMDKNVGTFVDGYVFKHAHNGRIHASIHPLRSDEGGTVSGRYSYSDPNLQNIPARDPYLGPLIRSMFVPDEGHTAWRKADFSQIEYRFLAHYAMGPGAEEMRQKYTEDPRTDYHAATGDLIAQITGQHLDRKSTKTINFGLTYGMSQTLLMTQLGLDKTTGSQFFNAYHQGVPFVKATTKRISSVAADRGYIKTILGRRARFPFWEAADWDLSKKIPYTRDKQALIQRIEQVRAEAKTNKEKVPRGGVRRAKTHKAANALFQGGSADELKKALLDIWDSGVCDVIGVPLVIVHDELDNSDPGTPEAAEAFQETIRLMENAIQLSVPIIADMEIGPNWGAVK